MLDWGGLEMLTVWAVGSVVSWVLLYVVLKMMFKND